MALQSIAEIMNWTGFGREKINKRLRGFPYTQGPRGARLYETREVLPLLYGVETTDKALDLNIARAKLAEKQIEKIEFDMVVKRGGLIPFEEIQEIMSRIFVAFRTRLMSLPTKAAPKVTGMADPVDAQLLLEDYVHEALEEISDLETFINKYAPPDDAGAEPDTSEAADDQRVG